IPVPVNSSSRTITQTPGRLVSTRMPNSPSPTAIMTFAATMTSCGAIRSAITPPMSRNTSEGAAWAAITYDRSAVDPVAASTANETPTSENVAAIGATRRSASSSRKLRLARTGKRRRSARVNMTSIQSHQVSGRPSILSAPVRGTQQVFGPAYGAATRPGHLPRLSGRLLTGGSVTKRRKCPAPSVQPPAAARHSAQTTSASAPPAPAAVRSSRIHRLGPQRPFCRVCLRAIGRQRPEGRQRSYRGGHSLMSILGTRVLRTEDPRFLTTGGVYTEDLTDDRLDGACHVFFVRSPVAHARVDRIDLSAALAAPGVVAAFTGADLAGLPSIEPMMAGLLNAKMTRRPLATDKVRFVGDPVAVVVTEDPYQGEDAVELVDVDYDPLPAVVDFDDSLSNEVIVFEAAGTNVVAQFGNADSLKPELFDGCEVVVGHTFVNQRVAPAPMETRT